MTYQSVNPYDGKTLKTFEELTDKQLEAAIATAASCFETGRRTIFAERAIVAARLPPSCARVDEWLTANGAASTNDFGTMNRVSEAS